MEREGDWDVQEMLDFLATHTVGDTQVAEGEIEWSPPADVYEFDGRLFVVIEAAGMKPSAFEVRVHKDMLHVHGTRRGPHPTPERKFHSLEWRTGRFEKVVVLPRGFEHTRPTTRYYDGVLEVSFPKISKNRSR